MGHASWLFAARVLHVLANSVFALPSDDTTGSKVAPRWEARDNFVVPQELDCVGIPEWDQFRDAVSYHAARGWPDKGLHTAELFDQARALVSRWRPLVCAGECRTTEDSHVDFLKDLGRICASSAHFERYIVAHYFSNRGAEFQADIEQSGFCLYGFITALVVAAQAEFTTSVARAQRLLYMAFLALGDYFVFDWLDSTSWPVTSFMLNIQFIVHSDRLVVLDFAHPTGKHPGEYGSSFLRTLQFWQGTSEAAKRSVSRSGEFAYALPLVTIWQFCQHTSVAGEAKTMLTRFSSEIGVEVRFIGNSLAGSVCRNYGLCATRTADHIITEHLQAYKLGNVGLADSAKAFAKAAANLVSGADILMCSQPPFWCRFLFDFGLPIFMYVGLPMMWDVRAEDCAQWAEEFVELARSENNVVISNSVFIAQELDWQFGLRVPAVRMLGLHTGSVHVPLRNDSVLVSRFGTNAALSECVFAKFLEANPLFPLNFVQLEAILFEHYLATGGTVNTLGGKTRWQDHLGEIKVPGMPYHLLASHRAVVCFPYDAIIFLFHEYYSMQLPVFVPRHLWRWMFGPLTLPSMAQRARGVLNGTHRSTHEYTPFFALRGRPLDVEAAAHWTRYTDWALLPHVQYFASVQELFMQLLDRESLHKVSARMKSFNEDQLVAVAQLWRHVALRLIAVAGVKNEPIVP